MNTMDSIDSFDFGKKKKKSAHSQTIDITVEKLTIMPINELNKLHLSDVQHIIKPLKQDEVDTIPSEPFIHVQNCMDNTYSDLLERCSFVNKTKTKLGIKPPIVQKDGSKRSVWINFNDTYVSLKRDPKHILQFFLNELTTTGSIDANNRLIIRGNFNSSDFEKLLKRYIHRYVMCNSCKSIDTIIHNESRLIFIHCNQCNTKYTIDKISNGYVASTKFNQK